jgi:hypothetical protein
MGDTAIGDSAQNHHRGSPGPLKWNPKAENNRVAFQVHRAVFRKLKIIQIAADGLCDILGEVPVAAHLPERSGTDEVDTLLPPPATLPDRLGFALLGD